MILMDTIMKAIIVRDAEREASRLYHHARRAVRWAELADQAGNASSADYYRRAAEDDRRRAREWRRRARDRRNSLED